MWEPHLPRFYFLRIYFCISCNSQNFYCWKCHFFFCGLFPSTAIRVTIMKWMPGGVLRINISYKRSSPGITACTTWCTCENWMEKSPAKSERGWALYWLCFWKPSDSVKGKEKSPTRNWALHGPLYLAVMDFLSLQLAGVTFVLT